jgi:hypothetical protein
MTVTNQTARTGPYSGNGSTTVFAYDFRILDQTHIVVTLKNSSNVETVKTLTTNYTVSGVGTASGGNITMGVAPASGEQLTFSRAVPQTQEVDLANRGGVQPEVLESAYDKLTQLSQDKVELLNRMPRFPVSSSLTGVELPLTLTANTAIVVNAAGTGYTTGPTSSQISSAESSATAAAASAAAAATSYDNFDDRYLGQKSSDPSVDNDGAALITGALYFNTSNNVMMVYTGSAWVRTTPTSSDQTAITAVNANASNINTVVGISSNVTTVAGISSNVTTVAGIASDVTAVAADATDIGAVAAKATEIGRLGTSDAVADMNTLGTAAIVTDMDLLGTSANVTAMGLLGTSGNVTAMGLLGISGVITDMGLLGTAAVVADMALLGTTDVVADMALLGTTDVIADMALLGTTDAIADMNTLGTAAVVSDLDTVAGISGDVSAVAAQVVGYDFSTTTTMADPGSGNVRFNHATLSSVSAIAIDDLDKNGTNQAAYIALWDDSTNTVKGTLICRTSGGDIATFNITGLTVNSGWGQVAVTHVASSGTFSNGEDTYIGFSRAGDKGAAGAGSGDVNGPGSATDNALARYNSTTGKLLQNSGVTADDSGNIAANNLSGSNTGDESAASATASGIVELATDAETITGTDTARAVTPANIQAKVASTTAKGIVELATNAEAVTGSDTARAVTPAGVAAAIAGTASGPSTVALTALAMVYSATDANINGTVGVYYLANNFETDSLATKTNAQYVSTFKGSYITYSTIASLNPVLSSYTGTLATGGSITVSANVERTGAYYAWKAFDNNYATTWSTYTSVSANGEVAWLKMVYGEAQVITKITMGNSEVNYLPSDFTFEGSNDGSTWTNLLSVTGLVAANYSASAQKSFDLTTAGSFTQYRLSTSDSIGSYYIAISKFECFGYTSAENITLAPTAVTIASANPSDLVAYLVINPQESITAGTDIIFKGSIDGGSTKATGTWTKIVDLGLSTGTQKELWKVDIDVDSQTGSSLSYEITTANTKKIQVCDIIGIIPT